MTSKPLPYKPAARTSGLVVQTVGDEVLVYDLTAHRAFCLNPTAAYVWQNCDGTVTVYDIASHLGQHQHADEIVWLAIDQLAEVRLLDGRAPVRHNSQSRRQAIKALGLVAMLTVPTISAIAIPKDNRGTMSVCVCTSSAQCLQPPCSGTCGPLGICV